MLYPGLVPLGLPMLKYFKMKSVKIAAIAACLAVQFACAQSPDHSADSVSGDSAVAAVVDGHTISTEEIEKIAMHRYGQEILDLVIDNYLIDREADRLHVDVSEAEIDDQVQALTEAIKPKTLEEGLEQHHQTLAELRSDIRHRLLGMKLAAMSAPPGHFVHAYAILVARGSGSSPSSPDAGALQQAALIRKQFLDGATFAELASQHSNGTSGIGKDGDIGILFDGAPFNARVVQAALDMKAGTIADHPVETPSGYYVIMVSSTDSHHSANEDPLYSDAKKQYEMVQGSRNLPAFLRGLRSKASIAQSLNP